MFSSCLQKILEITASPNFWNIAATITNAFATVVIAGFTFYLMRSSREQVKIARAIDSPRVRLSKLKFSRAGGDLTDPNKMPLVSIGFRNYGRTSAQVIELKVLMKLIPQLSKVPDYNSDEIFVQPGTTIEAGKDFNLESLRFLDFTKESIGNPPFPFISNFYVYGFIAYLDHLGERNEHGFVGSWIPPGVASPLGTTSGEDFLIGRNNPYSYDRKVEIR